MLKRGFQFAPGYRLQEFLGRGQFGQVWRATAPGGTAAAVKFIDLSDGQGQKEYDGIRRVKQIRHANLMPITAIWLLDGEGKMIEETPDDANETIDFEAAEPRGVSAVLKGAEPSWLVVAMLLGGKSLQARLRECTGEGLPGLPPKELISYMDESAKGLDFLNAQQHDLGEGPIAIQHCDVKPANIVLIGSSAVVCDFGLSRILTRNQVTATSTAGTPAYMAPEAISGKPSRTSDQYSLAVTYYHLRTGVLPVNDGSIWEVLDAHRQGNLKLGLVDEAEQQVLRKATSLDWKERFDTNVEMVEALREALRAEGHTRPSFVPPTDTDGQPASQTIIGKNPEDDPSATLVSGVLPTREPFAGEPPTATNTQPVVQAAEDTGVGIAEKTETDLGNGEVATAARTPAGQFKQKPWWLAGAVSLALVAIVAIIVTMSDDGDNDDRVNARDNKRQDQRAQTDQDGQSDRRTDETGQQKASRLLAEALATFVTDESTARTLFAEAIATDPVPAFVVTEELTGHKDAVMLAAWGSSGKLATVAVDAYLWDLDAAAPQPTTLPGHTDTIEVLAPSPDGMRIVTAGYDKVPLVWNLTEPDVPATALSLNGHVDAVLGVAWHPKEPMIVTITNEPNIGIWKLGRASPDFPNGRIEQSNRFQIDSRIRLGAAAIDRQGKWFATITDPIDGVPSAIAYRMDDLVRTLTIEASPTPVAVTSGIRARQIQFAAVENGPAVLVVGDDDGSVSTYSLPDDASSPQKPELIDRASAHETYVESLRVARAGNSDIIVTGSSDGSVHWWKTGTAHAEKLERFGSKPISSVDSSEDGRWIAAGSHDGSVWLWDASQSPTKAIRLIAGSPVHVVRIDPNGRWLIAGCADGVLRRWDLRWAKLLVMEGTPPSIDEPEGPAKTIRSTPLAASRRTAPPTTDVF